MAHPRAVAKLVAQVPSYRLLDDWQRGAAAMAALLHDVLEDTKATRFDMVGIGVPVPVVDIVQLLTFTGGDDREEYYRKIIANPVAHVVKIADVAHNTSAARTVRLDEEDRNRLAAKYEKAMSILGSVNPADFDWWREGR
jgi:(p)ppGpp synthase/HD superfamily hydrolase